VLCSLLQCASKCGLRKLGAEPPTFRLADDYSFSWAPSNVIQNWSLEEKVNIKLATCLLSLLPSTLLCTHSLHWTANQWVFIHTADSTCLIGWKKHVANLLHTSNNRRDINSLRLQMCLTSNCRPLRVLQSPDRSISENKPQKCSTCKVDHETHRSWSLLQEEPTLFAGYKKHS